MCQGIPTGNYNLWSIPNTSVTVSMLGDIFSVSDLFLYKSSWTGVTNVIYLCVIATNLVGTWKIHGITTLKYTLKEHVEVVK
jgi:hypothetical protein